MTAAADIDYLGHWRQALHSVRGRVESSSPYRVSGRIVRATGLVLEAVGLRAPLGSTCLIELSLPDALPDRQTFAEAEVVGFAGDKLFLMPQEELSGLVP